MESFVRLILVGSSLYFIWTLDHHRIFVGFALCVGLSLDLRCIPVGSGSSFDVGLLICCSLDPRRIIFAFTLGFTSLLDCGWNSLFVGFSLDLRCIRFGL